MQAQMKWSNADWMANNGTTEPPRVLTKGGKSKIRSDRGQLRRDYPEPGWLNDPSHRGKTLSGDLRTLEAAESNIQVKGINKVDCIKLQRNFGFMVKQLKEVPKCEWEGRAKAVLEHHFDNHEFCHSSWCKRMLKSPLELEQDRQQPGKFYRCKERDIAQYTLLKSVVDKYISIDKLVEVAQGYSTQMNESMNNNISWLAQKNKTLSGSKSLAMRIHLAVGITLVGYEPYLMELLTWMGIPAITEGLAKHLGKLWEQKQKMSTKHKDRAFKRERHDKKRKKMDDEIKQAEKKRRKEGWY
jgi:hypothetical protein